MNSEITIEQFSPVYSNQVFDLILPIQREEFSINISREDQPDLVQIPAFYQTGNGNFWIALHDEKVVGSIALKDIGLGLTALRKMFVSAPYRGKNKAVALALLRTAKRWAKERKTKSIYLGTTAQFHAAHRFYEKNGFAEISQNELPPAFPIMAVDTKFYRFNFDD
ncbi:MAG: GNAT family N-acetyltransferase [Syntrophobacteraceae bacterium]